MFLPINRLLQVARGLVVFAAILPSVSSSAATLVLENGARRISFDTDELLARSDALQIEIPSDVAYGGWRRYHAVPLSNLLAALPAPGESVLETSATDGFSAQIPLPLVLASAPDAPRAWLAIEPNNARWPLLPGKQSSAGPFYIVWDRAEASRVSPEHWTYHVATLRYVPAPAVRWPEITVADALSPDHPARAGQEVFQNICLSCHRMNGGGSSRLGPDLNLPMNPTEYFRAAALRRYIRDPASVRSWPEQKMPGFGLDKLSNAELDALIAYLEHMVERRLPYIKKPVTLHPGAR